MSMDNNTTNGQQYLLHNVLECLDCVDLLNDNEPCVPAKKILNTLTSSIGNSQYKTITYKKNSVSDETLTTLGLFRSVIFNDDNKMLSFAPPKSMAYEKFKIKYPDLSQLIIDEFIDGTMVNVFYDERTVTENEDNSILGGGWNISTRKNIGATNHFYRYSNNDVQRDFGELFKETFLQAEINVDLLDTAYCYSFAMCHPENRIVSYVKDAELYLTDAFRLTNSILDCKDFFQPPKYGVNVASRSACREMTAFTNSKVKYPTNFFVNNYQELEKMVEGHSPDGTLTKGYMVHCPITNLRTKIIPEEYKFVKELRGNFADLRLLFLSLHREGRVHEYLHYYPENYSMFSEYSHLLGDYIQCMYMLYRECFIAKNKPLSEYPSNFRTHMYKLHGIYKEYYKPVNGYIRHHDVVNYVNDLDIPLLFNTMFVAN